MSVGLFTNIYHSLTIYIISIFIIEKFTLALNKKLLFISLNLPRIKVPQ